MILFSYFLIFYHHDHTIIQIPYKNLLTSKGNKQGFCPPIPSKQCCGAVQAASKENIEEANLKWGGGGTFIFWQMSGLFDSVFEKFCCQLKLANNLWNISKLFYLLHLCPQDWGQASAGSRRKVCYHWVWTVFWRCALHSRRAGYFCSKKSGIKNLSWLCYSCIMQYFSMYISDT